MNGKELKDWRNNAKLSQSHAALKIGVGRSTVQKWEADSEGEIPKWAALAISAVNRRLAPFKPKP